MMKHFKLKLNHAIEIGARLAYLGHFKRTNNRKIQRIACDEQDHKAFLAYVLKELGDSSNKQLDTAFTIIGTVVAFLCKFFPRWSLNLIARSMEIVAVYSYDTLADEYPQYSKYFIEMGKKEAEHELYFKNGAK